MTFDAANKYLGVPGGAAAYDLDGNLTSISGNGLPAATFAWDDDNELTTLTSGGSSTSYGYDGRSLRVWSQAGGGGKTFYIFCGKTLLGEVNAAGSLSAAYTWGANGLVSERIGSTNKSLWYHFGPQGETRHLTDSTGAVADTYAYASYGVPTAATGADADANPFRYGGQAGYYTDGNAAGVVLCTYRWYSPDMGRWLSRDPISYEGGHNLYGYCGGNPVNGIDPSGYQAAGAIGGAVGAGVIFTPAGPVIAGVGLVTWAAYEAYQAANNWASRYYAPGDLANDIARFHLNFPGFRHMSRHAGQWGFKNFNPKRDMGRFKGLILMWVINARRSLAAGCQTIIELPVTYRSQAQTVIINIKSLRMVIMKGDTIVNGWKFDDIDEFLNWLFDDPRTVQLTKAQVMQLIKDHGGK